MRKNAALGGALVAAVAMALLSCAGLPDGSDTMGPKAEGHRSVSIMRGDKVFATIDYDEHALLAAKGLKTGRVLLDVAVVNVGRDELPEGSILLKNGGTSLPALRFGFYLQGLQGSKAELRSSKGLPVVVSMRLSPAVDKGAAGNGVLISGPIGKTTKAIRSLPQFRTMSGSKPAPGPSWLSLEAAISAAKTRSANPSDIAPDLKMKSEGFLIKGFEVIDFNGELFIRIEFMSWPGGDPYSMG